MCFDAFFSLLPGRRYRGRQIGIGEPDLFSCIP